MFPEPPLIVQATLLTVTPRLAETAIRIWLSLNQFGAVAVPPLIVAGHRYWLLIFSGATAVKVMSSVRPAINAPAGHVIAIVPVLVPLAGDGFVTALVQPSGPR